MIIDKPYVIDRETVKQLLQITDTTYDVLIDLYLPVVSEDVESICNRSFVQEYTGTLTLDSAIISDIYTESIKKGLLVSTKQYTQAIVQDADLDNDTLTVDIIGALTEESTILINHFPIAKRVAISQMIAFMLTKNNGITSSTKGSVVSKSLPPLSVTYDTNDMSLNSGYGYPSYIIESLKSITKPRFI